MCKYKVLVPLVVSTILLLNLLRGIHGLPQGDNYLSYDGFKVLRVHVQTEEDRQSVRELLETVCEVMKFPTMNGRPVDILCSPEDLLVANQWLESKQLQTEIVVDDMGVLMRETETPRNRKKRQTSSMNWSDYQRYQTIVDWMAEVAAANPSFTSLIDMGSSVEGRKIQVLKIGKSPLGDQTRAVWIDGGIHAREWISPATATFILNKLIENFKAGNPSDCAEGGIQSVDWYVAPLINPDGYEFTHTSDRLWRKNRRSPPSGSSCYGVDLNRNWNVIGYGLGADSNPCGETYKGTSKASEPETKAMANTILKYNNNIRVYVTFHSYGQYWLTSWGYKTEVPVDYAKQLNLGRKGINALQCINPTRDYTLGSSGLIFYIAGGASDDWAKATARIPYSYTIELPSKSSFVLNASNIIPIGNEMWAAMKEMASEAARHPLGADPAPVPTA